MNYFLYLGGTSIHQVQAATIHHQVAPQGAEGYRSAGSCFRPLFFGLSACQHDFSTSRKFRKWVAGGEYEAVGVVVERRQLTGLAQAQYGFPRVQLLAGRGYRDAA